MIQCLTGGRARAFWSVDNEEKKGARWGAGRAQTDTRPGEKGAPKRKRERERASKEKALLFFLAIGPVCAPI